MGTDLFARVPRPPPLHPRIALPLTTETPMPARAKTGALTSCARGGRDRLD